MRKVILRGDGNNKIGFGHIFRLLSIAEILKDNFECVFITNRPEEFMLGGISKFCRSSIFLNEDYSIQFSDEAYNAQIECDLLPYVNGKEIVVIDGYHFGENYQLSIKNSGLQLICIDDLAKGNFYSDIVINHAPSINKSIYKVQPYTRVLLGMEYAILRAAFFKPLAKKPSKESVFISLGGSDFYGYSAKLIDLLLQSHIFEELHVLCSSSFSTELIEKLRAFDQASNRIFLHFNLDAECIVEIMSECSHAFVSASTVLLEAYSRGLKCFTGYYASNQQFLYHGFVKERLAYGVGDFNNLDSDVLAESLANQNNIRTLTHSLSSHERILAVFNSLSKQ